MRPAAVRRARLGALLRGESSTRDEDLVGSRGIIHADYACGDLNMHTSIRVDPNFF